MTSSLCLLSSFLPSKIIVSREPPTGRARRWPRRSAGLLLGLSALLATPSVWGQAAIEDEFTVQRFNPAPGPRNFITTRGARVEGEMAISAGLMINYAYEPFVLLSCETQANCDEPNPELVSIPVIENMVTGDLMGTLTPIPRLQLGLRLPITWVKGQGVEERGGPQLPEGLQAVGIGDAELEGKFRLHGEPADPFVAGASLSVTGPLGTLTAEDSYIGDSTPTVGLRGIFDGEQGPVSFGGNIGGILRGSGRVGTTVVGPEFRYNVAIGYRFNPMFRAIGEIFGSTRFSAERGENALEGLLGLQVRPRNSPVSISGGVGTGLIEGVGVPTFRVFAGLTLVFGAKYDRDGDGFTDELDQCPTEAEDVDGREDDDGCPDLDNDLDTIPDASDKCPNEAEDPDTFEDLDGCPEPDNDKDGILDSSDRCPNQPETKNGFDDTDGCPDEADADRDGVPDSRDKCPDGAEDTDGHEDEDGCPDPDNDGDGIPDQQDECIDEPETKNGIDDADGCPD
jgi:hypothetical protein